MASEIRVNKINNRAGLGTITIADTGVVINGIVTCTEISGLNALNIAGVSTFASPLDINGDIDVDGHTNLDNLSVAGVATFVGAIGGTFDVDGHTNLDNVNISGMTTTTGNLFLDGGKINVGTGVTIESTTGASATGQATFTGIVTASAFKLPDGSNAGNDLTSVTTNIVPDGDNTRTIGSSSNTFTSVFTRQVKGNNSNFINFDATGGIEVFAKSGQYISLKGGNNTRGLTVGNTGVIPDHSSVNLGASANKWNEVHAQYYYGDGSSLSNLPAGAPVGGASTNTVFFENDKAVAVNYQVTSTKNAMSAGPIAINAGIAVTVPSGSSWTIV